MSLNPNDQTELANETTKRKSNLRIKTFKERESLLRIIFDECRDVQSLHRHMSIFAYFYLSLRVLDHILNGSLDTLSFIKWAFGDRFFSFFLLNWIILQLIALIFYFVVRFFMREKIPSLVFKVLFVTAIIGNFYLSCRPINTGVGPSLILRGALFAEQLRMSFKIIAFAISNSRKKNGNKWMTSICGNDENCNLNNTLDVESNGGEDDRKFTCSLPHYIYFLFAPTLNYRDHYVQSSKPTDWKRVASLTGEFLSLTFLYCEYTLYFALPNYSTLGKEAITSSKVITLILIGYICGFFIQNGIAYYFLHVWLNIWAEILRFGDRQFYLDWWSKTNFIEVFRAWNLVIGDFIFEYLFLPLSIRTKSRSLSALIIFTISFLLHDILSAVALGFFLPLFTLNMYVGALVGRLISPLTQRLGLNGKTMLTYHGSITASIQILLFAAEFFSRKYCPVSDDLEGTWKDFFIPRQFSCVWKVF